MSQARRRRRALAARGRSDADVGRTVPRGARRGPPLLYDGDRDGRSRRRARCARIRAHQPLWHLLRDPRRHQLHAPIPRSRAERHLGWRRSADGSARRGCGSRRAACARSLDQTLCRRRRLRESVPEPRRRPRSADVRALDVDIRGPAPKRRSRFTARWPPSRSAS